MYVADALCVVYVWLAMTEKMYQDCSACYVLQVDSYPYRESPKHDCILSYYDFYQQVHMPPLKKQSYHSAARRSGHSVTHIEPSDA